MENFEENPQAYFHYLKMCKHGNGQHLISECTINDISCIKCQKYYDIFAFKMFVCELIYNAINLFPDIYEYTIKFKNRNGTSYLRFGNFGELSDDGFECMGKIVSIDAEDIYSLSRSDIKSLYCNNRNENVDHDLINTLMVIVCMGGPIPSITTWFKINKNEMKNKLKFK